MNKQFKRMQKLAGILSEGYQGTDYESSEDMALDMVKTGAGMPGTGLPEAKKKMTKAEAKQAIKDAILAEMHPGESEEVRDISTWDGYEEAWDENFSDSFIDGEDEELEEAKKKKSKEEEDGAEEEVDLDLDMDLETDSEDASIDMDMNASPDMEVSSEDAKNTFDDLAKAYQAAKNLGDEKLIQQLANTITYFNKNIILK